MRHIAQFLDKMIVYFDLCVYKCETPRKVTYQNLMCFPIGGILLQ